MGLVGPVPRKLTPAKTFWSEYIAGKKFPKEKTEGFVF